MKLFEEFQNAIGIRESGNNYRAVNTLGYLGRYQFGRPRLWDLGFSIDGWTPKGVKVVPANISIISKESFLNNTALQDAIFRKHVRDLATRIEKTYSKAIIEKYSLSGLLAAAHLLGLGGVRKYINARKLQESGEPAKIDEGKLLEESLKDGYGTKITEYLAFKDYDVKQITV